MRFLKWISLGLGALVALGVLGVLVIVWFVDPNRFKPRIEAAVKEATGRELHLVGDIELDFFPWLALRAGEGSLANGPGFGPQPMVTWKQAQLGARLFPLLRGRLVADRVTLDGVELRLQRRADGTANWQGLGGTGAAPSDEPALEFSIGGIEMSDSRVEFVDEVAARRLEVRELHVQTDEISPGKPLTDTEIAGVLFQPGFAAEGLPFRLEVPRLVAPRDFATLEIEAFEAGIGDAEITGAVSGTWGDRPRLEGRLEVKPFDPRALMRRAGLTPPATTDPRALEQLGFSGSWRFDGGAVAIEPLALRVDDTQFQGWLRRGAGEDPVAEFELRGDAIDLARYVPPSDPASEPFVLPTAMLKALKFRGTLQFEQATLDEVSMKGVVLRLLLDEQGLRGAAPDPTP